MSSHFLGCICWATIYIQVNDLIRDLIKGNMHNEFILMWQYTGLARSYVFHKTCKAGMQSHTSIPSTSLLNETSRNQGR